LRKTAVFQRFLSLEVEKYNNYDQVYLDIKNAREEYEQAKSRLSTLFNSYMHDFNRVRDRNKILSMSPEQEKWGFESRQECEAKTKTIPDGEQYTYKKEIIMHKCMAALIDERIKFITEYNQKI
jgi:uncharacterized protein YecT (DUF1311 family)